MHEVLSSTVKYEALLKLLRTADSIWNSSRGFFQQWDLSPAQFNILNLLGGSSDGMGQSELGRELLTHRSNVTGLVDRLEAKGLVKRHPCEGDRRAWRVELTEGGKELWQTILPHYQAAAAGIWGTVTSGQARELIGILAELERNTLQWSATTQGDE